MSRSSSHSPTTSPRPRGVDGGGDGSRQGDGGGGGGGGGGPLVKVAFARNQAEAELLQGLLRESGIPSVLKRARGFDAPEFLAAGPHDVFVSSDRAARARDLLAETLVESEPEERAEVGRLAGGGGETSAARLALWIGASFVAAVGLVWLVYQLS